MFNMAQDKNSSVLENIFSDNTANDVLEKLPDEILIK